MNNRLAWDMATIWGDHLSMLTLYTPPIRYGKASLLLLMALPNLPSLTIHGSRVTGAEHVIGEQWGTPGLSPDLGCVQNMAGLQSIKLFDHPKLIDISHLSKLSGITNLTLVRTGVRLWPDIMSRLTGLQSIRIEQDPFADEEVMHPDQDQIERRVLLLCHCFFSSQPKLRHLSLKGHIIVFNQFHSCEPIGNSLEILNLEGSDFARGDAPRNVEQLLSDGLKPLQGLQKVYELNLSRFASFSGGWNQLPDMLCALGVPSMTNLRHLSLCSNRLESFPNHRSALTCLTWLDMRRNKLMPDAVNHPACLCLSRLQGLLLGDCMPRCILSALRASTSNRQDFEGIEAGDQEWHDSAANAAAPARELVERQWEPADLSRLKRACPELEWLTMCNAA